MCRRETNLFFFTLGDGSLPLGRNCATCVFEKSRNRVVLVGGIFEILWRKTTSTISPLEWHLPNSYTLHMLKECWRLHILCVCFHPLSHTFWVFFTFFYFIVVFAADVSLLSLYTASISGYLNAIKHVADQSWCLCGRDTFYHDERIPWGYFVLYLLPFESLWCIRVYSDMRHFWGGCIVEKVQFYREIHHKSLWCVQL